MSEQQHPKVTVYITNHNYGHYLPEAVGSVLNQTFQDFELLIIDDGSTDDSRDVIMQCTDRDSRIRVMFQENKGLNRTNNHALRAARGDYIMRLDADDYLDPNALLVMTSVLDTDPGLGLVFPDYYFVDSEGHILGQERRHDFDVEVSLLDQPAHGACTLIRKRALLEAGGYSEDYRCQDGYDLWLRIVEKYRVRNVNLPLFYYRRHGENLTDNQRHILDTRARIKEAHADLAGKPPLDVLALLPVRGPGIDRQSQVLEDLGGKTVLDWTIEAALDAGSVKGLIVSTPEAAVLRHVRDRYGNAVMVHERVPGLAQENVHLDRTMQEALRSCPVPFDVGAYLMLYAEFPFRSALFVEKAVNTMRIFDVDSVIGLLPETDVYFRHNGNGLELVGNDYQIKSLRVERDYLYRRTGGFQLVRSEYYRRTGTRLGGVMGQIILDEETAVQVSDPLGLEIARLRHRLAAGSPAHKSVHSGAEQ